MATDDIVLLLQINLQRKMRVTGIITQGAKRIGSPEYIKSYKIAYSNDGKSWATYEAKGTNEDMVRLSYFYENENPKVFLTSESKRVSLGDEDNCLTEKAV